MWGCAERQSFFNTKWLYGGAKDADQPRVADDIISVGASGMDAAQGVGGRERGEKRAWENHTLLTASQDTLKKTTVHGFASVSTNTNHSVKSTKSSIEILSSAGRVCVSACTALTLSMDSLWRLRMQAKLMQGDKQVGFTKNTWNVHYSSKVGVSIFFLKKLILLFIKMC